MAGTRRIVMFNRVTADGFFSAADGNLDWAVPEPELDQAAADGLTGAGTILFGRRTYEMFESFWPKAVDDSATAPDPHSPGRRSPEMHAIAVWINQATKIVFSRTRQDVTWTNSRLIREFDPDDVVAMRQQPGPDMIVFGSGSIASLLTQHGLVDEYQFVVNPLLLNSGRPLLSGVPTTVKLDLLEAKSFPSGNVRLRYARSS